MRVGLDVDGVVASFGESFTALAEQMGLKGAYFTPQEEQEKWSFPFHVDPVWAVIGQSMNWWMTLRPLVDEEEVRALNRLIRDNSVYFITNRGRIAGLPVEDQTRLWLQSIGVHAEHVIATNRKGPLCGALDLEWFIEDKVENLEDIQAHGVTAIARRWKYNERSGFPFVNNLLTVDTLGDDLKWLKS